MQAFLPVILKALKVLRTVFIIFTLENLKFFPHKMNSWIFPDRPEQCLERCIFKEVNCTNGYKKLGWHKICEIRGQTLSCLC